MDWLKTAVTRVTVFAAEMWGFQELRALDGGQQAKSPKRLLMASRKSQELFTHKDKKMIKCHFIFKSDFIVVFLMKFYMV